MPETAASSARLLPMSGYYFEMHSDAVWES